MGYTCKPLPEGEAKFCITFASKLYGAMWGSPHGAGVNCTAELSPPLRCHRRRLSSRGCLRRGRGASPSSRDSALRRGSGDRVLLNVRWGSSATLSCSVVITVLSPHPLSPFSLAMLSITFSHRLSKGLPFLLVGTVSVEVIWGLPPLVPLLEESMKSCSLLGAEGRRWSGRRWGIYPCVATLTFFLHCTDSWDGRDLLPRYRPGPRSLQLVAGVAQGAQHHCHTPHRFP